MIPKIIHVCWLSGESFPPVILDCLDSWSKYLSDYDLYFGGSSRRTSTTIKKDLSRSDYVILISLPLYGQKKHLKLKNMPLLQTIFVYMQFIIMGAFILILML